jgi:hypothetical protein
MVAIGLSWCSVVEVINGIFNSSAVVSGWGPTRRALDKVGEDVGVPMDAMDAIRMSVGVVGNESMRSTMDMIGVGTKIASSSAVKSV